MNQFKLIEERGQLLKDSYNFEDKIDKLAHK